LSRFFISGNEKLQVILVTLRNDKSLLTYQLYGFTSDNNDFQINR